MEGGVYALLGLLVGKLFSWLENLTKYRYDAEMASLRSSVASLGLENAALKQQNREQEAHIEALEKRITDLEARFAPALQK